MNKKQMAFWKYDIFPYCLCGEVIDMNDKGAVETKNFGSGHWFKPFLILPFEAGKKIKSKLDKIEGEYDEAKKMLHETYKKKLEKIVKIADAYSENRT